MHNARRMRHLSANNSGSLPGLVLFRDLNLLTQLCLPPRIEVAARADFVAILKFELRPDSDIPLFWKAKFFKMVREVAHDLFRVPIDYISCLG